jgi:hypothetical protein
VNLRGLKTGGRTVLAGVAVTLGGLVAILITGRPFIKVILIGLVMIVTGVVLSVMRR